MADPFLADVLYTFSLETLEGEVVAARDFEGPQLVWDYFGPVLDVSPPAPAGEYVLVVSCERESVGWSTSDARVAPEDDGISPLDVVGPALADGRPVDGVRMIGVDTLPAPNPVFRREFDLTGAPATAALSATVLGTGVIHLNGVRVGQEMLEPAFTDYDKTVLLPHLGRRTPAAQRAQRAGPRGGPRAVLRPRRRHVGLEPGALAPRAGRHRPAGRLARRRHDDEHRHRRHLADGTGPRPLRAVVPG